MTEGILGLILLSGMSEKPRNNGRNAVNRAAAVEKPRSNGRNA
ncbi:hypothetical protein [Paenibacillus sp. S150]|nr:hypothetical protein [Paenibacillus sp. S150]